MVNQLSWPIHSGKDSWVQLIYHDPSDQGSLFLIRIIPKERNLSLSWILLHGTNIRWINGVSLSYEEDKQMDCKSKQVVFLFGRETYLPIKSKIAFFQKSTFRAPVYQPSSSVFNVHPANLVMNFGPQFGLKISREGVAELLSWVGGGGGAGHPSPSPGSATVIPRCLLPLQILRVKVAPKRAIG